MRPACYCLFDTPLGVCGIAWREPADTPSTLSLASKEASRNASRTRRETGSVLAVTGLQLPEATRQKTASRIARNSGSRQPSAPPPYIAELIAKIRRHLQGEPKDFREVPVDLDGAAPFARQVYKAARQIPPGETRTYGEIAKALGQPAAARDVGEALSKNPIPLIIPCHRVSAAGGKSGGFSAHGGRATKARLLALEGAPVTPPLFP